MNLLNIIYIISIACIATLIFYYGFKIRGPWGSFWTFFLVLFLAIWGFDAWIEPRGPENYKVYWFPPLIVGVIIALILAAATPKLTREVELDKPKKQETDNETTKMAIGTIYWMLIMVLLVVALSGLFVNV
ncbi:MAG: hypothetical protein GVY19_00700 [Bacteroidetes bacterium]|jgi:hypothetical protein|nr:hypothetical protein [Bacteroidota bacterium]